MNAPLLKVSGLTKSYSRGLLRRRETFRLEADFEIPHSRVVGVLDQTGPARPPFSN